MFYNLHIEIQCLKEIAFEKSTFFLLVLNKSKLTLKVLGRFGHEEFKLRPRKIDYTLGGGE